MFLKKYFNKSLTADIRIHIRRGVVQVPNGQSSIRSIRPITSELSKPALRIPKFVYILTRGRYPPLTPSKRFSKKPTADRRMHSRRGGVQDPKRQASSRAIRPRTSEASNSLTCALIIMVSVISCRTARAFDRELCIRVIWIISHLSHPSICI